MDHVYFGLCSSTRRSYERIRIDNVNFNCTVSTLVEKFREVSNNKENVSFTYCGDILDDCLDEPISRYLKPGSTIHIIRKAEDEEIKHYKKFSELDVSSVSSLYRSLNSGNFHKISRPEVAKAIFDANPELKKDVVAMSILKDPILLSNLQNPETIRNLALNHRVLIESSDAIVKALKSAKNLTEQMPAPIQPNIDDFSDSSSSSSGSENHSSQARSTARITQEFLRQSLAAAQGRNSLSNISQRNLSQAATGSSNPISPSTSSNSVTSGHRFISSSMFMNAMNDVLRSNRRTSTGADNAAEAESRELDESPEVNMEQDREAQEARDTEMITSFQVQIKAMEDMGLQNKVQNIQALMVCNGNLEAAVNLVLAQMNTDVAQ